MSSSEEIAARSSVIPHGQEADYDEDRKNVVESSNTFKRKLSEIENEKVDDSEEDVEDEEEEAAREGDGESVSEGGLEDEENVRMSVYRESDEENEEVQEQFRRYYQELKETERFGVTFLPKAYPGAVHPLDFASLDKKTKTFQIVNDCVRTAIERHNSKQGTNLKLDKILHVTYYGCAGFVYYITFNAKETDIGDPKTYQTEVYYRFTGEMFVEQFRLKPESQAISAA